MIYSPATHNLPKQSNTEAIPATPSSQRPNWPFWFCLAYIGFQVSLLLFGATPLRVPLRIAAYSLSLLMAAFLRPGRSGRHPSSRILPLVLICIVSGLFMPGQSSQIASIAQVALYIAIVSPLLWVSNRTLTIDDFTRIIMLLWAYNSFSAVLGVFQVYYPSIFQTQLSSVIADKGADYVNSLTIQLSNGARVFRPMGLTDTPGGAANGGSYAILFGIGLLFTQKRWLIRTLAACGMLAGLVVIFLSQVRVALIFVAMGTIVVAVAFARRGDLRRTISLIAVMAAVAIVSTTWAFAVGGDETIKRFATLTDSAPVDVYGQNRGFFLSDAFGPKMFDYPFGQGAGRWGMMAVYFGDPKDSLWAEIMWQAWLYDGGIPLMVSYCVLLLIAIVAAWKAATTSNSGLLAIWAAVLAAYDLSAIAATFDAPVFGTQVGLEFWFINACLFNALANRTTPQFVHTRRNGFLANLGSRSFAPQSR